jgi:hypothetical protein
MRRAIPPDVNTGKPLGRAGQDGDAGSEGLQTSSRTRRVFPSGSLAPMRATAPVISFSVLQLRRICPGSMAVSVSDPVASGWPFLPVAMG